MSDPAQNPDPGSRVLLLVTTRRDAEISGRLLRGVGLVSHACETLAELSAEVGRGAAALLTTEEAAKLAGIEALVSVIHPAGNGLDLPTVILTQGGTISTLAGTLLSRLQNLTILERPAPVSSILSAVQSAVRVRLRQRELVQQMERVRDLQAQLEVALTASELGTFHCPLPLGALIWDAQCKAHFWLPPDAEVTIDRFYAMLHPDDRARVREAVDRSVRDCCKYEVEYRTMSNNGQTRWIRATGHTRSDESGRAMVFSGTTQDITKRRQLEEERDQLLSGERAARIAGERANRQKDEFLATLGHELRTPLNAIMGWVELLKVEADPDTLREAIDVIERNVRAQAQLIDDLLDVSRIVSGKVRLNIKSMQLADAVAAAIETVTPAAVAKGVSLESIVQPHAPAVSGDAGRLQQVIWNLLTNAIKFTPQGGKVQLLMEQVGSFLEVAVTDTGEGIDPDFLPHVFERFSQADGSPSRRHSGLGLGLSIVKNLVEMHGGRISVHSAGMGQGSTFRVQLPVQLVISSDLDAVGPATGKGQAKPRSERPDLTGITVLVVDDEPDARAMMHRLLEGWRATSFEAANSEEAMRLLAEAKPNLIVSDIGMPGTDGYEFLREVRRSGVSVPAVALTAFARSEDRVRSINAGFQAHLSKPIEAGELLSVVASLCGRTPPSHQ